MSPATPSPCHQHQTAAARGAAVTADGSVRHPSAGVAEVAGRHTGGSDETPHAKENTHQNKPVHAASGPGDRPKGGNRRGAVAFLPGYRPYPQRRPAHLMLCAGKGAYRGRRKGDGERGFVPGLAPSTKMKGRPPKTSEMFIGVFGGRAARRVANNALARPGRAG